jgi:hypothetical protein
MNNVLQTQEMAALLTLVEEAARSTESGVNISLSLHPGRWRAQPTDGIISCSAVADLASRAYCEKRAPI